MYMNKDKPLRELVVALQESGISSGKTYGGVRQVIQYWIRHDKLVMRRKPQSNYYVVTDEEIQSIVKAFSHGGEGHWSWQDTKGGETIK